MIVCISLLILQSYSERTDLSVPNNMTGECVHSNPPAIESSVIDIDKNEILATVLL